MFAPDAPGELGDLPNPDMLRRPTMRREAQSTSALEGTFEPLETVLAQDYEVGEDKSGLSESMARGAELPRRGGMRHRPDSVRASHKPALSCANCRSFL